MTDLKAVLSADRYPAEGARTARRLSRLYRRRASPTFPRLLADRLRSVGTDNAAPHAVFVHVYRHATASTVVASTTRRPILIIYHRSTTSVAQWIGSSLRKGTTSNFFGLKSA